MMSDIEIENQRLQAELAQLRQNYEDLAIDGDCLRQSESRLYDDAEIATLKIVADSIAAAITSGRQANDRQQKDAELRKSEALLQAEQERSQELERLNHELQRSIGSRSLKNATVLYLKSAAKVFIALSSSDRFPLIYRSTNKLHWFTSGSLWLKEIKPMFNRSPPVLFDSYH